MFVSKEKLKQVLVDSGLLTEKQFEEAEKEAKGDEFLQKILVEKDFISDKHLGEIISDISGIPFISLRDETILPEVLNIVPELVARKQQVIAFKKEGHKLFLAMANPENLPLIRLMAKKTGDEIVVYYATPSDIEAALEGYRSQMMEQLQRASGAEEGATSEEKKKKEFEEGRIIKIVDDILTYSYQNGASDIHIEPYEKKVVVRYRIDGILHDVLKLKKEFQEPITTRIKVLAQLRTDEHFSAQDGRFSKKLDDERVDIRVSIMPVSNGEKIVMRMLSEKGRKFDLDTLGLLKNDRKKVDTAILKPYGMILATGPTGSGKTTTMYAILKILNKRTVNIATIEDPIEYDIEGVNQVQVNPKADLTFANGLRSIVRQDPDIIMVGEIRDEETAGIAVNAAMTGHLVLSTLHTNDAATTLPRLLDMEIEPFLVASTVNVIIAQRLLRKICTKCITSYEISRSELEKSLSPEVVKKYFPKKKKISLFKGTGCKICSGTGYRGRIGIFEVMEISENIRQFIMKRANADEIEKQAIAEGMTTMFEDGIKKVIRGITTIEEILRVTKE